jgi:hypothetical protein
MAGETEGPPKTTQRQAPPIVPKHDRTGGPMTGGMVENNRWANDQVKAAYKERLADAQRQDRARPDSEPTRPGSQPQAELKTLRKFEDRHPAAPDRAAQKPSQSAGAASGQTLAPAPKQTSGRDGARSPDHYKELKKFEDRHPSGPGHDRSH